MIFSQSTIEVQNWCQLLTVDLLSYSGTMIYINISSQALTKTSINDLSNVISALLHVSFRYASSLLFCFFGACELSCFSTGQCFRNELLIICEHEIYALYTNTYN